MSTTFRYAGWHLFCPVLLSSLGASPIVSVRWKWLEWAFDLTQAIEGTAIMIMRAVDADYEPLFMFHHVKRLPRPIFRED